MRKSKFSFFLFVLSFMVSVSAWSQQEEHSSMPHFPLPDESVLRLLTNSDIAYANAWWMQAQVGGTFYDARRDMISARWSPGIQVGKRYGRFGYFGNLQLDQSFDFNQEVKRLDVIHVGPGVESLFFLGRMRSSASAGVAILATDTDIDLKGKIGWYVELRPVSVRWDLSHKRVLEFTPLGVNLSVPVTTGIPLVLFGYFTTLSLEWAGEPPPW